MLGSIRARLGLGVLVVLVLASIGTYAFLTAQKPAAASNAAATLTIYKGTAQRAAAGSSTFSPLLSGQGLNRGDVPTGLTLDAWGHLTGTPTVAGTYTFTVTATDTVGQTATHSYTIAIS